MIKESLTITTSTDNEGIFDDYYLNKSWRNLGWLLPQRDYEGILGDYYLNGMMKESLTIATPKGNEGICDDWYSKR